MKFDRIDWNRAFFKNYFEKRSFGHLLVNFNRIWVIHISVFWFFTAYNSPSIYRNGNQPPTAAMTWSATALGGGVSTLIMIFACITEFTYLPTTWNNTAHLTRRLAFLFVVLALTVGPTFYIVMVNNHNSGNIPLIIGIVQFFISVIATLLFATLPSGRLLGDRVGGKSRKYLASQTFTAAYPELDHKARTASIVLWVLIFGCKFAESYFFLTGSFRDPIAVMVGMKVQGCSDKYLGHALCRNHAAFTLTIMYIMDMVLFFLDTFLWYVIWSTVLSIGRSFSLGLSIWTPWKDIYSRLPKRIYAKLLATGDMQVKYKPKVCSMHLQMCFSGRRIRFSFRFLSLRFGMPLSSRCTANIYYPSITYNASCIIRLSPKSVTNECSAPRHSSFLRRTQASRANFSRRAAKPLVVSLSSPNHSLQHFPSHFPSIQCPHSLFSRLTTPKRSSFPSVKLFVRRTVTPG